MILLVVLYEREFWSLVLREIEGFLVGAEENFWS
jgi:hypothetical protein